MPIDGNLFGAADMPPLDLGETMTMGHPPPQSAPSARASAKEYAPLLALLPIVAAKGGQAGVAALLQGFSQQRQQRQQSERQSQQDAERQRQIAEQERMRRAQLAQTTARQREADRRALLEDVQRAVGRVDSPDAVRALLPFYAGRAQALGMPVHELEAFALEQATPTVLQRRAATAALEQARKLYGDQASQLSYQMAGEDQPVPYDELQRRAGVVPAIRPTMVTYADLFPETRTLAIGSQAVPTLDGGPVNLDAATRVLQRMGVIGGRRAGRTASAGERRQTVSTLDEEAAYLLRSAARGQTLPDARQRWAKLVRAYESLGIPFDARRDAIRVRVERELRGSSGSDALIDDALDGLEPSPVSSTPPPGAQTAPPPAAPPAPLRPGVVYRFENGRLVPK